MLSRLPISLAKLKAGNNSKKIKNKLGKCSLCTDQKNLQKISTKDRLALFKHGNNVYEHWK